MPPEPYPPFFLSRETGAVAPARPEPVLGWHPAPESGVRERWPAGSSTRTRLGRFGGFSVWCHGLALAATLLWAQVFVPPEPVDDKGEVAMVFAPAERAAQEPALPPAVETEPTAAPAPLVPPPPEESAPAETAALSPATTAMAAMAAPPPDSVQAMTPPAPPKPAERPTRPAPARMAKAAESRPSASSPVTTSPPASPQLAVATPLVPPHPLSAASGNPTPLYPISAARRREQGRVVLRVDVTADGRADAVQVAVSSGFSALDRAAIEAVRLWRFVPATRGGTPVPGAAEVPINFTLSN